MNPPIVVVGAGLPGITASLALAKRGKNVVLADAAPEIGGLLQSYEADGGVYDFGTHFANRTGVAELDELLFGGEEPDWVEFPVLLAGNYWCGRLNDATDTPDLNAAGREVHDRGLAELLAAPGWNATEEASNARDYLVAEYGPTLVESFFDPVFRKFTGAGSEELHSRANLLFNLKRVAVLDAAATAELKKSPRFDGKVAFHHRDDFDGHRPCIYPREGGIGNWIKGLEAKLAEAGVRVLTGCGVRGIETDGDRVVSLTLGEETVPVEAVVWSVAPAAFCHAAGLPIEGTRPLSRATVLAGIECDRPFLSDLHYITVFDPALASFRVTLYPNFRNESPPRHLATVEFIVDPAEVPGRDWKSLGLAEMKRMGLAAEEAVAVASHERTIPVGFPVPTGSSVAGLAAQAKRVGDYANVRLVGRASGTGWFLDGLIRHAYATAMDLDS